MNRDAKRINSSSRREIDIIKGYILTGTRPFDGVGYPFKKALSELRKKGVQIKYNRKTAMYVKVQ